MFSAEAVQTPISVTFSIENNYVCNVNIVNREEYIKIFVLITFINIRERNKCKERKSGSQKFKKKSKIILRVFEVEKKLKFMFKNQCFKA